MKSNKTKIDWTSWISATIAVLTAVSIVIGYLFNQRMTPFEMRLEQAEKDGKAREESFSEFKKSITNVVVEMGKDIKCNKDLIVASNKETIKLLNTMNIKLVEATKDISHMKDDIKEVKDKINK